MQGQKRNLVFTTEKGNEIWLSSLSLAWKEFEKGTKAKIEVPQNAQNARSLIECLRSQQCTSEDVDQSVYYQAGARAQAVILMNKQLEQNFSQFQVQKPNRKIRMDQAIFYGALYKQIKLAYPFYNIPGKIMHFRRIKVPCFQPMDQNQRNQVFVLKYTNEDNFFLRINLLKKDSQMFLLMTKNKCSLQQVFQKVIKSNEKAQPLTNKDVFKIPQLKIQTSHYTTDLNSVRIKFPNEDKKYQIVSMEEHVILSMPGSTLKDKVEDLILTVPDFESPKLKQRRMCLRDPFWMVLRHKGRNPYFAMYVNKATDCYEQFKSQVKPDKK